MFQYLVYASDIEKKEGYPVAGFNTYEDAKKFVDSKPFALIGPFGGMQIVKVVELTVKEDK